MGNSPSTSDPYETAAAQTGTNVATSVANAQLASRDVHTPYGSSTSQIWNYTPWTDPTSGETYQLPKYVTHSTLSAPEAKIFEQNTHARHNLASAGAEQAGYLRNFLKNRENLGPQQYYQHHGVGAQNAPEQIKTLGDAGEVTTSYQDDFSADRQRVEDALMARLNPQIDRDREAMETRLANQGFTLGSEGYARERELSDRAANDARLGAILGAGQEQSRLTNLSAQEAGFRNQAQNQQYAQNMGTAGFANAGMQADRDNYMQSLQYNNQLNRADIDQANANLSRNLQERYTARNQPINEISALLSGSQVNQAPMHLPQAQTMPTVDIAGLINQDYQNRLAKSDRNNSMLGGLFGGVGKILTGGLF